MYLAIGECGLGGGGEPDERRGRGGDHFRRRFPLGNPRVVAGSGSVLPPLSAWRAPDERQVSIAWSNGAVPYELRDQPSPIEDVILHLAVELRQLRLAKFETQTRLSAASGISQGTWSKIENGLAEGVRLEMLARIAAVLRVDIVLRPCRHPPGFGRYPPNGRTRRTPGATRIPGTRNLLPGSDWDEREPR